MNALLAISSSLRETSEAILQDERAIAPHLTRALAASLLSLQKRKNRLKAELSAISANGDVDASRQSDPNHNVLRT